MGALNAAFVKIWLPNIFIMGPFAATPAWLSSEEAKGRSFPDVSLGKTTVISTSSLGPIANSADMINAFRLV